MSDSGGNAFGEALESMTTNTKQAIGGTIADFGKSVKNQATGNTGISGSFTPGDLFSPDVVQRPQNTNSKPQTNTNPQSSNLQMSDAKTPEEAAKIQNIEAELAQMQRGKQQGHREYFQKFLQEAEGRGRNAQVQAAQKQQEVQNEEIVDLQKKEEKKAADDASLKRAQQNVENKGGGMG